MNFQNRLVKQKIKYTWAKNYETQQILKVSEYKLYNYRKKVQPNQLIEGVHYKRVPSFALKAGFSVCIEKLPIIYNLEKTCKRIHFIDLKTFTDPNIDINDPCQRIKYMDQIDKEFKKYWPYDKDGIIDIKTLKNFTEKGVYVGD